MTVLVRGRDRRGGRRRHGTGRPTHREAQGRRWGRSQWRGALTALTLGAALAASACGTGAARGGDQGRPPDAVVLDPSPSVPGPSAVPTPPVSSSVHPVTTVVVTDDRSVAAAGPSGDGAWPGLLAASLQRAGAPLAVTLAAVDGTGFAPGGPTAVSFTDLVADRVARSTQLVIFFDTDLSGTGAATIGKGAAAAFAAVEEAAPDARIVVVAPYRFAAGAAAPDEDVRTAVQEAVRHAEVAVTYIDPVAEDWPTGATQQQIADLLHPPLVDLVRALAESGAFE